MLTTIAPPAAGTWVTHGTFRVRGRAGDEPAPPWVSVESIRRDRVTFAADQGSARGWFDFPELGVGDEAELPSSPGWWLTVESIDSTSGNVLLWRARVALEYRG